MADEDRLPSADELPQEFLCAIEMRLGTAVRDFLREGPGRTGVLVMLEALAWMVAGMIEGTEDPRLAEWFAAAVERNRAEARRL